MDWTDLDHDDQATLVLGLVSGHGRAAPLLWLTVWKEELKNQSKAGRARKLRDARVTAKGQPVGAVVCVHANGMKQPWCLATSQREATAATLVNTMPSAGLSSHSSETPRICSSGWGFPQLASARRCAAIACC